MSQLMCIKKESSSDRDNRKVGDVVGIFSDEHVFSGQEYKVFDIIQVKDSREEIETITPVTERVFKNKRDEWVREQELDDRERVEDMETKEVWYDSEGSAKEIVEHPRFVLHWDGRQVVENYSRIAANNVSLASIGVNP